MGKFKMFMTEARKADLEYKEEYSTKKAEVAQDETKKKAVRAYLKNIPGQIATKATKLAKVLSEMKALEEEAGKLKIETRDDLTALADDVFDAKDALYTRIMETASLVIQVSKQSTRTSKDFNEEKFWKQVEESGLAEDLLAQMKICFAASWDITHTPVASSAKVELKESTVLTEGKIKDFLTKITNSIKKSLQVFKRNDKVIGKKLKDLSNLLPEPIEISAGREFNF